MTAVYYQRLTTGGVGQYTDRQYWKSTVKPYIEALPYFTTYIKAYRFTGAGIGCSGSDAGALCTGTVWQTTGWYRTEYDRAYARAYDRFVSKAKNTAGLAVSLVEGKQAVSMIARRATQLVKAAKSVLKGDVVGFWRAVNPARRLRRGESRTWRSRAQTPANLWLELQFGWKPLVKDINDSVEVLQRDFGSLSVRSSAQVNASLNQDYWSGSTHITKVVNAKIRVVVSGRVVVNNPNLYLANSYGFVNVASIAWELVPFSFVADWFVPVGRFLSSMTDLVGLNLQYCSVGHKREVQGVNHAVWQPDMSDSGNTSSGVAFERTVVPSLTVPGLMTRAKLPTVDLWLATTSISLLLQTLRTFDPKR